MSKVVKKPELIPDWKDSWKFLSVQLAGVIALLDTAYEHLPIVQQYLPEGWVKWFAIAIIVARVIKQKAGEESGEISKEKENA